MKTQRNIRLGVSCAVTIGVVCATSFGFALYNAEKMADKVEVERQKNVRYLDEIDSLQAENDSLQMKYEQLESDYESLQQQRDELQAQIEENKQEPQVEVPEEPVPQVSEEPAPQAYVGPTTITPSGGVYNYNGRKETYYSSNVLYHYRTPEWTQDAEGFWRDSAGNYVVAASDLAQGTVFDCSKGSCAVYDSGCAPGVTDYYVAW